MTNLQNSDEDSDLDFRACQAEQSKQESRT